MKYPTTFHLISDIFAKKKAIGILIGGFAVNYYKLTRQTADIDFLITQDDFERIAALLEQNGFKKDYAQEVFVRFKGEKPNFMDIDFMFVDKETLDKIIKEGNEANIAGVKFIIPSLAHLIALKLHSIKHNPKIREYKDLLDIIELIRINKVNVENAEFRSLCLKYGTEALYHRIVERV